MRTALLFSLIAYAYCSLRCDSTHSCPDEATCCRLSDGEWGCCPMENAVCCSDHVHCCPNGMRCDVQFGRCTMDNSDHHIGLFKKYPAIKNNDQREIICPDHTSKCPEGSTCCRLATGRFGCCPAVGATCCNDHLHCCPHGMTCDTSGQRCLRGEYIQPWLKKFEATAIRPKPAVGYHNPVQGKARVFEEDFDEETFEAPRPLPSALKPVRCGPNQVCSAQSTCCESVINGQTNFMCCPLKNGVCCKNTCCPRGYHCLSSDRCERKAHFNTLIDSEMEEEDEYY